MYNSINDAHTALINSGVLECFNFDVFNIDDVIDFMYRNDKTPEQAAEHFGYSQENDSPCKNAAVKPKAENGNKMKNVNLNDLKIDFVEYCLNDGFFFVVFENGESVQCCLASDEVIDDAGYSHSEYKAAVNEDNNGFDEGLNRDCNRWASHDDECEWGHINEFLIEKAKKAGLEII